jgi:hypothetical protein
MEQPIRRAASWSVMVPSSASSSAVKILGGAPRDFDRTRPGSLVARPCGVVGLVDSNQDSYILQILNVLVVLTTLPHPPDVHFGLSLPVPVSQETRMRAWKVLFIVAFGCVCLVLALATVIVPMTVVESEYRWLSLAGLLVATVGMGTLFKLFLRRADRILSGDKRR